MASPAIIASYTTLKNAVEDHLNRADVDTEGVSAMVIDLAEARINRDVRHPQMLRRSDSFTVDAQYKAVPTGFMEAKRFILNTNPVQALEYLSLEEMGDKRMRVFQSSGRPLYFTIAGLTAGGRTFEFLPTPDSAYTGLLTYYERIPALAGVSTNWLLDDNPDVYLSACLVEAHLYYENPEMMAIWEAKYNTAVARLVLQGQDEALGATPIQHARSFG